VQPTEIRIEKLMLQIKISFATRCLALIIDDVWDFQELSKLQLPMGGSSSLMVTSRALMPFPSDAYSNFNITGENNRAQAEAILASYVALDPAAKTVPAHLQVLLLCMHCYPPALVQVFCLECGVVPDM
jgi:hypothetical protein